MKPRDPFDALEEWVNGDLNVAVLEAPREPDGYMNCYEIDGQPKCGKPFYSRTVADRALEIARLDAKACFRVAIYLK